jgi:hypothetical protein
LRNAHDAAVKALTAGVNMEMSFDATVYLKNLANAVKQNQFSLKRSMTMVRPVLEAKSNLVYLRTLIGRSESKINF